MNTCQNRKVGGAVLQELSYNRGTKSTRDVKQRAGRARGCKRDSKKKEKKKAILRYDEAGRAKRGTGC